VSFQDTVDRVEQALATGRKLHIATGNLDFVMRARRDPAVARELWETDLVVADGVPVLWAAGLLGEPLKGRVNGTDLVWECARVSARTGAPLALVGAMPEAARSAARRLAEHAPGAVVHAIDTPYPLGPEENRQVVADIRAKGGRIVLVALGAPKQERWIRDHLEACGGVVGIGIGSAFDLISGTKRRAPAWMQRHGFEWLHRMAQEPGRLGKRYLVDDLPFFWYLLKELFRRRFGGANRPGAGQEDR
jgi:N-acetylglucosaminyldiphosphoundecaprenol N-acetyl-beta-D-mannosaminyltransferase